MRYSTLADLLEAVQFFPAKPTDTGQVSGADVPCEGVDLVGGNIDFRRDFELRRTFLRETQWQTVSFRQMRFRNHPHICGRVIVSADAGNEWASMRPDHIEIRQLP